MSIAQRLNELSKSYEIEFTGQNSYCRNCYDHIDQYNSKHNFKTYLGVNIGKNRWAWFYTYADINDQDYHFFFDHVYNQNSGKMIKAYSTGYRLIEKLKVN